jgi:hypothetical protein
MTHASCFMFYDLWSKKLKRIKLSTSLLLAA